jgi:HSP20 family molecular chaperone IbpA
MAQELVSTAHQRGSSQIHLTEDDHQYLMKIHAPELSGHELTDLDLQIENEALILSIPALELPDLEGFTPVWEELVSEAQVKRIRIPRNIDFERVRATLCGDTLEVTLPKHAQIKRSITITQSKAS